MPFIFLKLTPAPRPFSTPALKFCSLLYSWPELGFMSARPQVRMVSSRPVSIFRTSLELELELVPVSFVLALVLEVP